MSINVNNAGWHIKPVVVMFERLEYWINAGKLFGLTFNQSAIVTAVGKGHKLPLLQGVGFDQKEEIFQGAYKELGNHPVNGVFSFDFFIHTETGNGFVTDNDSPNQGLLNMYGWIKDAIDKDPQTGRIDPLLNGTLLKPVKFATVATNFTEVTLSIQFRAEFFPIVTYRANRMSLEM